ncbi:hypothetical protein PR202_ga14935 [Eleusine coracana subsp. coracana]|uniref:NB-ARC domain-containing protein n=1 Tax=Eleusine coracana subsp. coracana TaxID=191504 RepID=A0AAV5CIW1_ELECO|nr:hypothetical protein PR202_ga14935 [Eleusine coracana subsp. coracana]
MVGLVVQGGGMPPEPWVAGGGGRVGAYWYLFSLTFLYFPAAFIPISLLVSNFHQGVHLLKMGAELMVTGWFLSPIIKEMQDTALSYIRGQYSWKKDQEKDLERLNTMLTEILTIVDVIEKREIKNGNQRKLLGILKNAIYSAVDVLDSFQYMVLHSKVIRQSTVTLVTTSFVEMGKRMLGTTKFRRKLTDILEKLGEVKTSADTLLRVVTFDNATAKLLPVTQLRVTSPLKEKNHIYGRRAELDKLRDMLLEVSDNSEPGPSDSNVPVISIVGVGGIGKTSLAQVAFNDEQIRMNFTHKIWVSVSDSYDEVRLARDILEYVTDANHHTATEFDELQNALQEKMEGKKFLLVLDDVCCAFGDKYPEQFPELKKIGIQIIQRLNGLPLAAKIIGRLLNVDLNLCFSFCSLFPKDWRFDPKMLTEMWVAQGFVQKEYPYDTDLDTEDVAKVYFDELVQRSFFERSWLNLPTEYVMHDLINDLARHVSKDEYLRIENEENEKQKDIPANIRHLSISADLLGYLKKAELKNMRSLLVWRKTWPCLKWALPDDLFKKSKNIRVLDLTGCCLERLPTSVKVLKHLRYFAFRVPERPWQTSLIRLYQLEVLVTRGHSCRESGTTISGFGGQTLVHGQGEFHVKKESGYRLVLENCTGWVHLPPLGQIPLLKYLELRNMHAVRKIGPEFYGNGDTKGFPRLEDIVFDGMHNWEHWSGMDGDSLLPCLERLYITKCPKLTESPAFSATPRVEVEITSNFLLMSGLIGSLILQAARLIFHVSSYSIFNDMITEQLNHVAEMNLKNCVEPMPSGGFLAFSSLMVLRISNCLTIQPSISSEAVEDIDTHFLPPSLLHLEIAESNVEPSSLPKFLGGLTHLSTLVLNNCSVTSLSFAYGPHCLTSLETIIIKNCHELASLDGFLNLVALRKLVVADCYSFCSLPSDLNTVEPLDTLVICGCPMMTFLPQDGLPASMQMILLSRCHPEFDSQLRRKEGAEWNKIAHIPEKKLEPVGWVQKMLGVTYKKEKSYSPDGNTIDDRSPSTTRAASTTPQHSTTTASTASGAYFQFQFQCE